MIVNHITMRSTALEMDTKVTVLFPEDRHVTKDTRGTKYPVLYILHGAKEDNDTWLNLSNIMLCCRDLDLVVVMPTTYMGSYVDAKFGQKYYTWISEELPVKIKNLFPVTNDPNKTFIMGESMGGYGTMRIAFSKPQNYGKAVVLSCGNINPFNNDFKSEDDHIRQIGLFGSYEEWKGSDNDIDHLIDKLAASNSLKPAVTFYCGKQDRIYQSCLATYNRLKEKCPNMKVDAEFWNGEHNFFFWNQAIPKALKKFGYDIPINSVI